LFADNPADDDSDIGRGFVRRESCGRDSTAFQRERDLRGFDAVHGWMHTVAHTSDALKFLMRNPKLASGSDARLLSAVRAKIEASDVVFIWG